MGDWRDNDTAVDAHQSASSPASAPETAPNRINQALLMPLFAPEGTLKPGMYRLRGGADGPSD